MGVPRALIISHILVLKLTTYVCSISKVFELYTYMYIIFQESKYIEFHSPRAQILAYLLIKKENHLIRINNT